MIILTLPYNVGDNFPLWEILPYVNNLLFSTIFENGGIQSPKLKATAD